LSSTEEHVQVDQKDRGAFQVCASMTGRKSESEKPKTAYLGFHNSLALCACGPLQKTQSFAETTTRRRRQHPDIQKYSDAMRREPAVDSASLQQAQLYAPRFVAGDGIREHSGRDAIRESASIKQMLDRLQARVEALPLRLLADAKRVRKSLRIKER